MTPVIAIVGRPNVGKSTLFNKLTRTRDALVADRPGVTRDWQSGHGQIGTVPYIVIDTGGLDDTAVGLDERITGQALAVAREAQAVILVVDARAGRTSADDAAAEALRPLGRPVHVAVNKSENLEPAIASAEFHALGWPTHAIAAEHGTGLDDLMAAVLTDFPAAFDDAAHTIDDDVIRITVIGRPNVGKSTLVNRMFGSERLLTADEPGTTRDSVRVPFERDGRSYVLIDTAGVRRRARIEDPQRLSVIKSLQAIEAAQVVIAVLDARDSVTDQDLTLIGLVVDAGRALVVAVNKWDGLAPDRRAWMKRELERRLRFIEFATVHFISALHGTGVGTLFKSIERAWRSAHIKVSSGRLTDLLEAALLAHQPPMVRGRRIKLRYAHLGGENPPVIVIHGNQTAAVPRAYQRYLEGYFREALHLEGTPLRLELRTGENPFAGRRNVLSPRQIARRRRLMTHVKRRN